VCIVVVERRNEQESHSIQIKVKGVCVCFHSFPSSFFLSSFLSLSVALLLYKGEGWKKGGGA